MKSDDGNFGYPMNLHAYATRGIIWGQRKVFKEWLKGRVAGHGMMPLDYRGQAANDAIRELILSRKPCLVARFGCVELEATLRGYDISRPGSRLKKFAQLFTGSCGPFWWDNSIKAGMLRTTGVFPADEATLMRFAECSLESARPIDILGTWNAREWFLSRQFFPKAKAVHLDDLNAFRYEKPWTSALEGRRVLVVHPFDETIRSQYARRELLFADKAVLPPFELLTYKPVTSFLGLETPYRDWFEALDKMCRDIAALDFDVAILGCGAYGMPLGAFIKQKLGRQAVHLGGVTQILFGIRGGRWDNFPMINRFYNDAWVRPGDSERPANFRQHEGGAYW